MSTIKLKPCPFCGSDDLCMERSDLGCVSVLCNDCETVGPVAWDKKNPVDDLAAQLWNNRPLLPEQES